MVRRAQDGKVVRELERADVSRLQAGRLHVSLETMTLADLVPQRRPESLLVSRPEGALSQP